MPGIVYACVCKRADVQVACGESAPFKGSLKAFLEGTVSGPAAHRDKGAFTHGPYSYNFLREGSNTFVAIAGKEVDTRVVFNFLLDMRHALVAMPAFEAGSDKATYTRTLRGLMVQYEKPAEQDRIRRITAELDEVKGVMRDNLDKMVQRGDLLESLDTATQALESDAGSFKKNAVKVKKVVWWRRIRCWIILGAIALVLLLIIIIVVCGGFTFKDCGGGS